MKDTGGTAGGGVESVAVRGFKDTGGTAWGGGESQWQ